MFFGWAWIPPLQAVPQLLPLLDDLVVTITDPASGSTVSSTITVKASVGPLGVLVAGVQFKLDGVDLGAEDTMAPYSVPWDTSTASKDTHTLTAVARNMLGLRFTSGPVRVTVFNDKTPPTVAITSPNAGSIVAGPIDVSATASDDVAVAGVQFKLDGVDLGAEDTTAPYSVPWDTSTASNDTHTLTAVARNMLGLGFTSGPVRVTVFNDKTPPTVAITSPNAGSIVAGPIDVSATASDDVAVAGVQFKLDGLDLGAEDTTAPYSVPWDTSTATNNTHTLTAVARDSAGNRTTSSPVTVTVFNDK